MSIKLSPGDEVILVYWLSCLGIFVVPPCISLISDALDFITREIIKLL